MAQPPEIKYPKKERINKFGLNMTLLRTPLSDMIKNLKHYTHKELARDLVKMAYRVDSNTTIITTQNLQIEETNYHG